MAINLAKQVNNGVNGSVSGNFWVTRNLFIAPDYSHSRATMALFTDQASYVSGASPLYQTDFLLTGAENAMFLRNLASIEEPAMIANVPFFSGGSFVSGY